MNTEDLIQKLVNEGPQKPMPHPMQQTMIWLLGMLTYLLLFSLYSGFRSDISEKLSELSYIFEMILLLGLGITAALSAFCLSRPDGHQMPWLKYVPFGFLLVWTMTAFSGSTEQISLQNLVHSMSLSQFDCPLYIILFSVPPGIALFFLVRMGVTTQCYWAGSMATLSVTTFGYLLMRLIEGNDNPIHLIVWHALPIMIICLIGMVFGKILLTWR